MARVTVAVGVLLIVVVGCGERQSSNTSGGGERAVVVYSSVGRQGVRGADRGAMTVIATWPVVGAKSNYPMALDEGNHRLFVGCRRPAKALVHDIATGKEVTSFDIVGDADDLFYDAARKRLYVSGGEGYIDVFEDQGGTRFARVGHVATAAGARTSLFVAEQNQLYLAVPHRGSQKAEIRIYEAH